MGSNKDLNCFKYFADWLGDHTTKWDCMWSGKCVGISFCSQFLYTPFGAIIKAESINFLSYNILILSIKTLDFPVPISIK